jgi:phosphoenolpyruvate carboxykinase (ATP)
VKQFGPTISSIGLDYLGLTNLKAAHWNYSAAALYEQALVRGEAKVAAGGPLVAITGQHTGRSPNDKFIVQEASTSGDIWWGNVNKPIACTPGSPNISVAARFSSRTFMPAPTRNTACRSGS